MKITDLKQNKDKVCETILRSLPEWFGLERYIQRYIKNVETLPLFAAEVQGNIVGFIALKFHNPCTAEIYVMGVKKPFHRRGIGSALVAYAENYLRKLEYEFLTVKTLADSVESAEYAGTRKFYDCVGFKPLEVFPDLWDPQNPCLFLVKFLR